jgi:hypothetical protein
MRSEKGREPRARAKDRPRPRHDHEPPAAIARWGWRYHHLGIPTAVPRSDETHLRRLKIHVSGFRTSPFGIEWMRFEPGCAVSELVRNVPHIAFEVDDLEAALRGMNQLGEITSPSPGVRVAMIDDNGAPVELIEFTRSVRRGGVRSDGRPRRPLRPAGRKKRGRRAPEARNPLPRRRSRGRRGFRRGGQSLPKPRK